MHYLVESSGRNWRQRYTADQDTGKASDLFAQAERAIVNRVRILFHEAKGPLEERSALDAALYGLRMLRQYRDRKIVSQGNPL
jgi:hypothetical protein